MLEYLNEIEAQLLLWLPTITSVLSVIGAVGGLIFKFKKSDKAHEGNTKALEKKIEQLETKVDNMDTKLTAVVTENIALKKKLNNTLTKIEHVYHEAEE